MGHKIKSGRITNVLQEINISGLSHGIYYIDMIGADKINKKLKLLKK